MIQDIFYPRVKQKLDYSSELYINGRLHFQAFAMWKSILTQRHQGASHQQ
jgi:hypothetical protein